MVKTSFILHIHRKPLEMMGDDQDGVCNWYSSEEEDCCHLYKEGPQLNLFSSRMSTGVVTVSSNAARQFARGTSRSLFP